MALCDFGCTDLPVHEELTCTDQITKGGFSSIGILDCDTAMTDFTLALQYTTAIAANELVLIEPVRGEMPEPSAVTGENLTGCGNDEILDSFDRTFTWVDGKVSKLNAAFYDALNKKRSYLIMYNCGSDVVRYVRVPVSFQAREVYPASKKEKATWMVTATWTNIYAPEYDVAPAGIFNDN